MAPTVQKIDGFSLDNILQIFSIEKKSQTLQVMKGDKTGLLDIDQGGLIHAQFEQMSGLPAALEILTWEDVQIEILQLRPSSKTIAEPLIALLLEVSKRKDEQKSALNESGEELLTAAIDKAERQEYKEAHQDLVQYLKTHRTSAVGWLWYSRIQGNVAMMKKALDIASSLSVDDGFVKEEQRKFDTAVVHLSEGAIRKCCFCWAPHNTTTTTCPYCRGLLVISRETLSRSGSADPDYLHQAQLRYERIVKHTPRNPAALYCLGLMYVNRLNFSEALGYLGKAVKIVPEDAGLVKQLQLLHDHLAQR